MLKFRATGPEHGGGNLQIWYTKENQAQIGSNSAYTVDKFQGLVIVVDMHGGPVEHTYALYTPALLILPQSGGIRGFLNDGTTSFKDHQHLDQVAFGHCEYSYRNLGRPTRLQLKQDSTGFEVTVDERLCFRSDAILLPTDNYFGITGASSETPDSFEVFKFVTTSLSSSTQQPLPQGQAQQPMGGRTSDDKAGSAASIPEMMQDALASSYQSSQAQFEDLHNRIQAQGHTIENLFAEYIKSTAAMQGRIEELHSKLARFDQVRNLESKLSGLESDIAALRKDFQQKDYSKQFQDLHAGLKARHDDIIETLPDRIGHCEHLKNVPSTPALTSTQLSIRTGLASGCGLYSRSDCSLPR